MLVPRKFFTLLTVLPAIALNREVALTLRFKVETSVVNRWNHKAVLSDASLEVDVHEKPVENLNQMPRHCRRGSF